MRLLVILNPGRVSRLWMESFVRAARSMGILGAIIEVGDVWAPLAAAGEPASSAGRETRLALAREISHLCKRERITHALGYVSNLAFDCGVFSGADPAQHGPVSALVHTGVRHLMLWSDHPNWAAQGKALDEPTRRLLGHPMHTHFLKSASAAAECRRVLGWRHVHALHMGEDPATISPAPDQARTCDVTTIMSDVTPVPGAVAHLLNADDPDPREMMRLLLPDALRRAHAAGPSLAPDVLRRWAQTKVEHPGTALFQLVQTLAVPDREAIKSLRDPELGGSPRRWYEVVGALQGLCAWRRSFWTAWLARRMQVEVHGSPAQSLGVAAPTGDPWVEYREQGRIYARGSAALTINAPHDEEGMSHKVFQVAAAGVPCIHHATNGLEGCFTPDDGVLSFVRGPELLEHARMIASDPSLRRRLGEASRARFDREHTWAHRLQSMLESALEDDRAHTGALQAREEQPGAAATLRA